MFSLGQPHVLGVILGLGAAIMNALQSICIRKGTDTGRANHGVLVVMLTNVVILGPAVLLYYYPEYHITPTAVLSFAAAGLLGTMLGRAFMYTSIEQIGVSRTVPVVAGNALVATILGVIFLGESFTIRHGMGIVLIVLGVATIAWETSQETDAVVSRSKTIFALALPIGAAVAYGAEPIFANYGFAAGMPAAIGLVFKTVAATIGFTGYLAWRRVLPGPAVFRAPNTRWFILAGLANTLFLLGYYGALSIGTVNVVVPLVTTNTLWAVLLSAVAMPDRLETVTWRLWTAAIVVVTGVILVTLTGA